MSLWGEVFLGVIAVAVVVERGGRGGEVASPIAGQVIKAALGR